MTELAVDFLDTSIDPSAVKAAGYAGVLMYTRVLTAAICEKYLAAGLGVATIFEYAADESLQGAAKGTSDGQMAARQLRAVGQPPGTLHTVNLADFAPAVAELPNIVAYWDAYLAETSAWHVLPYGTGWLAQAAHLPEWQNAMNDNGVAGSLVAAQAVIYQRTSPTRVIAGVSPSSFDEDVILSAVPWWTSQPVHAATPTAADPPTTTTAKERNMILINDGGAQYLLREQGPPIVLPPGAEIAALAEALATGHSATPMPTIVAALRNTTA